MEFKNIVVTTDLSENAAAALPYAVELARRFGGSIRLVHVFEDYGHYARAAASEGVVIGVSAWIASVHKDAEKKLRELAERLSAQEQIAVTPVTLTGNAPDEIANYAAREKVDCIAIATHGRTGLRHMLSGSVAERVVRMSPCPVLSIRPEGMKQPAA